MQTSFRSNYQDGGHSLLNNEISTKVSCAVQCIVNPCNNLTLICVYYTVFNDYKMVLPFPKILCKVSSLLNGDFHAIPYIKPRHQNLPVTLYHAPLSHPNIDFAIF